MKVKDIQKKAYEISKSKGFWDNVEKKDVSVLPRELMLITSEVSECCELDRESEVFLEQGFNILKPLYEDKNGNLTQESKNIKILGSSGEYIQVELNKPISLGSEFADVIIRVAQLAEHLDIDLEFYIKEKMNYNSSRAIKHGGKKY